MSAPIGRSGSFPPFRMQPHAGRIAAEKLDACRLELRLTGGQGLTVRAGYLPVAFTPFERENWNDRLLREGECCPPQHRPRSSYLCTRNHGRCALSPISVGST